MVCDVVIEDGIMGRCGMFLFILCLSYVLYHTQSSATLCIFHQLIENIVLFVIVFRLSF